ncbi:MAG: glycosyltransferase [bacterium]|nr:glycosyltransferase [bacterium]
MATDLGRISIIIPTLNEGERIGDLLSRLKHVSGVEIIVADGGSTDETRTVSRRYGALVVTSPLGRGRQMNAGANRASGDILLFLHADTRLPSDFPSLVRQGLEHPNTVAGAFRFRLDDRSPMLAVVEWLTNLRCLVQSEPYGDQALFMCAAIFHEMGGYPDTPILEDVILVRRLKRRGRITILKQYAVTSSRRWKRLGIMTTFLFHRMVMLAYALGVQPSTIARWLKRLNYYRTTQPTTDLHRNEESRSCIQGK